MGKESSDMEFDDGKTYWPGTDIVKSPNNAFSLDHDGPHIDWASAMASSGTSAKHTADVERRRAGGVDPGTFHGISRKADEVLTRHGGAYTRAVVAKVAIQAKPRGQAVGECLLPNSKCGLLRALLVAGPKTCRELAEAAGMKATKVPSFLQNDVRRQRVVKVSKPGEVTRYAWAGMA